MQERLRNKTGWKEILYLGCLAVYIVAFTLMLETSGLNQNIIINWDNYYILLEIIRILLSIKLLCDILDEPQMIFLVALTGFVGYMTYQHNPANMIVMLLWFLLAGRNVSEKKIIQILFWSQLFALVLIFMLCLTGQLSWGERIKGGHNRVSYGLGFEHPNLWAFKVFLISMLFWLRQKKRNSKWFYLFIAIAILMTYWITDCRTIVLLLLLLGLFSVGEQMFHEKIMGFMYGKKAKIFFSTAFLGIALANIIASFGGGIIDSKQLFGTFGSRLIEANLYFKAYGLSLWGKSLTNYGMNPEEADKLGIYTLDNGYMYLLLAFGVVIFVLFLFLHVKMIFFWCEKRDYRKISILVLYTLYGMLEMRIVYMASNFLLLFLFEPFWEKLKKDSIHKGNCKVRMICQKVKNWLTLNKEKLLENIYLLCVGIVLVMAYKDTTMISFAWPETLRNTVCILAIVVVFAKSAVQEPWELHEIMIAGIVALISAFCWYHYKRNYILELGILVIGARGVSMKKILKTYLVTSVFMTLLTCLLALSGQIENLKYVMSDHMSIPRYALGSIYPTDFMAHLFYISVVYVILRGIKITYKEISGIVVLGMIGLVFCGARTNSICIFMVAIIALLEKQSKLQKMPCKIQETCCFSMPIAAIFMILGACLYNSLPLLKFLDQITNQRFSLGYEGLSQYPLTLLGQGVEMQGNGGVSDWTSVDYFFIDCSYINVLLQYGILMFLLLIFLMVYIAKRFQSNKMFFVLLLLTIVSINCMMEHHLIEMTYVPFFFLALAEIDTIDAPLVGKRKEHETKEAEV